ncbi:MAG: permease [Clostridiales bacterium]|nr:permease [Clostridiales bacterium]MCF8023727.1 permease [Clostridiales bacterium]
MKGNKTFTGCLSRAAQNMGKSFPVIAGVILLIGLFQSYVSREQLASLFTQSMWQNTILGTAIGSISGGNAVTSYIIGGELLKNGVSLFAVTAFLVAWVTVAVIQIPAEISFLGTRFTLYRNALNFIFSILISIVLVYMLGVIS